MITAPNRCRVSTEPIAMKTILAFAKFLISRKRYWLLPIFLVLAIFGVLIVATQGTAAAPFVYALW